jgi:hypothetical protein
MKKALTIIAIVLTLILVLTLIACSQKVTQNTLETTAPVTTIPETTAEITTTETLVEETVIQIPEDWEQFTGSGFELYLPEKWDGSSRELLNSKIKALKDAGQNQLASQIEASLPYVLFFAYDTETVASETVTNINIVIEPNNYASLEEYMDANYEAVAKIFKESGYSFNIVEQDIVPLGNYEEVGRTIIDETAVGVKMRVAQYAINPASDVWTITCTAGSDDFESNIQTFDKIAETFKITK